MMNVLSTKNLFDYINHPITIYFAIALLHLFSALYFAIIRWFHVCAPYKHNPDYYYPARKWLSLMCLFALMELPYVFCPMSNACFLTACFVLAWNYPLAAVYVCYAYFQKGDNIKRYPYLLQMWIPILFAELVYFVLLFVSPDLCGRYYMFFVVVISTVSFLLYVLLALCGISLYHRLRENILDNYSDEDKIPTKMAYVALFSMLTIFVLTSLPLILQSRTSLAIVQAVLIIWHVIFLVYILDSQVSPVQEDEVCQSFLLPIDGTDMVGEGETEGEENNQNILDKGDALLIKDQKFLLLQRIEKFMQEKKPYLNSHFTAVELATELGTNRTYLTQAIKIKYESFYHLVNSYRLMYAQHYLEKFPDVKKEQLSQIAGFGSYRSYIRACKSEK